jgi:predicted phosphoribosyltransferase
MFENELPPRFQDRHDAGRQLAARLLRFRDDPGVIVLGLPRGGVPVAWEVSGYLRAPMDVFVVRKLGVPGQEELAMGAIASGGAEYLNRDVIAALEIPPTVIVETAERERRELERRERLFRRNRPPVELQGKTVLLIDDGLATGATMRAAVRALVERRPKRVVVAVPVGASTTCAELAGEVDEVVCLRALEPFFAVGAWYEHFGQISDEEVRDCLESSPGEEAA